ncbi:MAG: phosphoglycerate kinase [Acholeplasmatales bacterium]|jgi:phosphoglycerate kinase|nr:phosphoglycerate kinase [Acholeplasmatales bacterium]
MSKKTLNDLQVRGKKVLVRVDYNVPLDKKTGAITDTTRIEASLPTINYLVENGAKIILLSHLGRIEKEEDKEKASLKIVAEKLSELMKRDIWFSAQTRGYVLEERISRLNNGDILLVENTRFEDVDSKKESKNNAELASYWASLGDVFVMDAFGSAHRAAASVSGIPAFIGESAVGFLMEKEIKYLQEAINDPKRPLVAILGGAKVSDKIEVIKSLLKVADKVIIGGGMAYTFYKALGYEVGKSLLEADKVELALELMKDPKLILGDDCIVTQEFSDVKGTVRKINEIQENEMGMDIGPETIKKFSNVIKDARTIVWNGPLGVFEFSNFEAGTKEIALVIGKNKKAVSIIGGGDSASAVTKFGLEKEFTHISTGGGASLEFLEGKKLPGIEAIQEKDVK